MSNAAKLNWDKTLRTSLRLNKRPYRKAQSFNYYAPMVGWKDPSKRRGGFKITDRRSKDGSIYVERYKNTGAGVYFIEGEDSVKVGVTVNRRMRMKALQGAASLTLHYIGWIPCDDKELAHALERRLHAMLRRRNRRVRGEWFRLTVPEVRIIQDFGKAIHAKLREKRQAAQAALNLTAA